MSEPLPIESGLLARLRAAHAQIAWNENPQPPALEGRAARDARLHDETARIETWSSDRGTGVAVTSGPVGALVLLVEIDRRGAARALGAFGGERAGSFPDGSIVAVWGDEALTPESVPRLKDLVELARYALA